jgi:hypothetical protein
MSEPTGPPSKSRPPVVPVVLGVLLVAVVVAAGLLVERATDGDADLPETLAGGFRATDVVDEEQFDSRAEAEKFADDQREYADSVGENLEDVLDATVTARNYQDQDAERLITMAVVDAAAGPFAPNGPLADPERMGLERGPTELVREDDVVCRVNWGQVVVEGDDVPDADPVGIQCQLGADGRTYWLLGGDLSVDDAVDALESLAD